MNPKQISLVLPVILLASCGRTADEPAGSTVQGQLAVSSFPSVPSRVEAIDESGTVTQATLGQDDSFAVSLPPGRWYRLSVVLDSGSEPVVYPRQLGMLDLGFRVQGPGAVVDLGAVHHLDAAPAPGFVMASGAVGGEGELLQCADGVVASSGAPCADDTAQVWCTSGNLEDGDQEGDDDDDDDDQDESADVAQGEAGECVNGVIMGTGAPCEDDDESRANAQADPSQPMAYPEHNAPPSVGGCGDDDDDDDDDDEEEDD